ncbi:hypothetical protein TW65_03494 [Stemphylium lycopersici]|nr:hypothetical protein TW65_03494 [Stemphylium lycopersici]
MSCTGNLDTQKIVIDDPELLRMFVIRYESRVIDTSVFDKLIPVFALKPTGLPLETGDEDEVDDHELFQGAWKVCRLIWDHEGGAVKGDKEPRYSVNADKKALSARTCVHSIDWMPSSDMRETANEPLADRQGKPKLGERRMISSHSPAANSHGGSLSKKSITPFLGRAYTQSEEEERWSDVEEGLEEKNLKERKGAYYGESMKLMWNEGETFKGMKQPFTPGPRALQLQSPLRQSAELAKLGQKPRPVNIQHLQATKTSSLPSSSRTSRNATAPQRVMKPRNPTVLMWPTSIITTGTSGTHLRPLTEQMGEILKSNSDRQEYMHLVWTRRRAVPKGDNTATQPVVDDLEKFVRRHEIVGLHNLWARWMDSGIKTRMPMFKISQPGVMNEQERAEVYKRKRKA